LNCEDSTTLNGMLHPKKNSLKATSISSMLDWNDWLYLDFLKFVDSDKDDRFLLKEELNFEDNLLVEHCKCNKYFNNK